VQVVWFKRDLRVRDHRPLVEASARGELLCLYVHEPELLGTPGHGALQVGFINESLHELRESLRALGGELTVRVGSMPEVLDAIHCEHGITALYSHRETGNRVTYERDLRVGAWAGQQGIPWHEYNQFGVVRRLKSRDGWAAKWARFMTRPLLDAPTSIRPYAGIDPLDIPSIKELGLEPAPQTEVQHGGESIAHETLASFLETRGAGYRYEMSSPVLAGDSCSRLSPYLAFGNISLRTVYQLARARAAEIKALRKEGADLDSRWLQSLSSFQSRLRWHCHFMQKLEDEPELEHHALNRALDGVGKRANRLPARRRVHARAPSHRLDQLPYARDADVVRELPSLVAVASDRASPRSALPRLRARYSLQPSADAVRRHRDQCSAHLFPDQTSDRPGP
jgi:deoxyribodipyrimidine photo-lyase